MSKRAVIFPGQGAQYVGMGRDVFDANPRAKELYSLANEVVGFDLTKFSFDGPSQELSRTDISQVAILVHSWVMCQLYQEKHPEIEDAYATCGLSLGEYTALIFSKALTFKDALRLVKRRGELMQKACDMVPSGMSSVIGMTRERIEEFLHKIPNLGPIGIANINSPDQIVISGTLEALKEAKKLLEGNGAKKVLPLKVAGAFHSELMKPAQDELAKEISNTTIKPPKFPVIANCSATSLTTVEAIRDALVRQLSSPVLWLDSVKLLIDQKVEHFYEFGPGNVLAGLLKRINPGTECKSIGKISDLDY